MPSAKAKLAVHVNKERKATGSISGRQSSATAT